MSSLARAVPILILAVGCSSPTTPEVHSQASYDPDALATAAFAEYDRDKNGSLEGSELDACPALKSALVGIDTNRDGKISTAELKARIEGYGAAGASTISVSAPVTLDGQPLPDATVQFVPEAFMGGVIKEATGKTEADGTVRSFTSEGKPYAGLQPGLYRVKVTREGGPPIPAKFNMQTTLGAEVYGGRGSPSLAFALTSR
jgi:hypothetical protein